MSITQKPHNSETISTALSAPPPPAVLPPESPLRMPKQELLPSPVILQRTFWRQCGDSVLNIVVMPVRLTRAVHTFCFARHESQVAE